MSSRRGFMKGLAGAMVALNLQLGFETLTEVVTKERVLTAAEVMMGPSSPVTLESYLLVCQETGVEPMAVAIQYFADQKAGPPWSSI